MFCCLLLILTSWCPCSLQLNSQRSLSTQRRVHQLWIWKRGMDWTFTSIQSEPLSVFLTSKWMICRFVSPVLNRCCVFVILVGSLCSSILLVDPTAEEESLLTSQLTVVTDEAARLCAVHKPGQKTLEFSSLSEIWLCEASFLLITVKPGTLYCLKYMSWAVLLFRKTKAIFKILQLIQFILEFTDSVFYLKENSSVLST